MARGRVQNFPAGDILRVRGAETSGRGHPARAGTGLLSPTASNAPGWKEKSPAARSVPSRAAPGWKEKSPAARSVPDGEDWRREGRRGRVLGGSVRHDLQELSD